MPRETLPGEKQAVLFSAGGTATTRTEVGTNDDRTLSIAWAEADEVGIYGRNDGRSSGDNYAYTATPYKSDATRCSFSASDSYELFTWTKTAAQSYYAYYPYAKITDRTPNPEAHPFSLPALQTQSEGNSPAHIARYGLMTAAPVDIPAGTVGEGAILFNFANVFSIVELRFKMTADCALTSVPVKQVRLLSDAAALAIPAGTIDLTRAIDPEAELPVVIGEGGGSLTFDTNLAVTKTDYASAYLVAAPGTHPAGTLRLEVTAIDNSIYGYTIPEQVVLRPNRHYTKSYELSLDEFVLSDEFEAEIPVLSCKVGEPLTVSMTGIADRVDFWSGEEGHDYAYAEKDRYDDEFHDAAQQRYTTPSRQGDVLDRFRRHDDPGGDSRRHMDRCFRPVRHGEARARRRSRIPRRQHFDQTLRCGHGRLHGLVLGRRQQLLDRLFLPRGQIRC